MRTPEGQARISEAVAASNRRRGEQNPLLRLAKRLYCQQKQNAKHRGIAWRIAFVDWWRIWQRSGRWERRGRGTGTYCMCRIGDQGAYEVGNVYVNLNKRNTSEANLGKPKPPEQREKMSQTATKRPRRQNGTFAA